MDYRKEDKKIIEGGLKDSDPLVRRQAETARYQINNESRKVKSMREALVKAHRKRDINEVKDIHDFIRNKEEYGRYG